MSYGAEMSLVLLAAKNASNRKELMDVINRHSGFQSMKYETARLVTEIVNMDFGNEKERENEYENEHAGVF